MDGYRSGHRSQQKPSQAAGQRLSGEPNAADFTQTYAPTAAQTGSIARIFILS